MSTATPASTRYRRGAVIVAGAAGAVVLIAALVWFTDQPASANAASATAQAEAVSRPRPALTVSVAQPSRETLPIALQANGNVSAWQEASVGAEVNGLRLTSVNVNVGDTVRKGQVLAVFATEATHIEILQSRAALLQAEASFENAGADAERVRAIQDTGALSQSQIDLQLIQERVAKAQLEAARAALAATQLRLENTQVRAPDDGVISARMATVGAVVGAGQELFRLLRQGRMEWRGEVTASEVGRIRVGQRVQVTTASGAQIEGKVRAIAPSANEQTRNILVFVDLPRHHDLRAGTFARGSFAIGQSEALTVPASAIVVRDGSNFLFVIDAASKASARKVQVGRRLGERVELLQGLQASERVALQGAGFLNDGDLVKVVE